MAPNRSRTTLLALAWFIIGEKQQKLYGRIAAALKPSGHVVLEGAGGPGRPEALSDPWSKVASYELDLLRLEYREDRFDWSRTATRVSRMLLQKPS